MLDKPPKYTTETLTALQGLFDRVGVHLLTQRRRAINPACDAKTTNQCVLRAPDGSRCAIGCLILDPHYDEGLEGLPLNTQEVLDALRLSGVLPQRVFAGLAAATHARVRLLTSLQVIHDTHPVDKWRSWLQQLAEQWSLHTRTLDLIR